jgi:hypothetical protein
VPLANTNTQAAYFGKDMPPEEGVKYLAAEYNKLADRYEQLLAWQQDAQTVIDAARETDGWLPQLDQSLDHLHPQQRTAFVALRDALARFDANHKEQTT